MNRGALARFLVSATLPIATLMAGLSIEIADRVTIGANTVGSSSIAADTLVKPAPTVLINKNPDHQIVAKEEVRVSSPSEH